MNITELRKQIGQNLGFGSGFDGTPNAYSKLSASNQIRLTDAMAQYIANHPSGFTPDQVAMSERRVESSLFGSGLNDTSFDWGMFGNEMLNEANTIVGNVGKTLSLVLLVAAVVWVIRVTPQKD